jgi:xylan 1,4-beta-xylosidase
MIDLGKKSRVRAIQVNFAEHAAGLYGRDPRDYHQYIIQYSIDNKKWRTIIDKSKNMTSVPHEYIQLQHPVKARYVKLLNHYVPDSNFAIRDLRVFGKGFVKKPKALNTFQVHRNAEDTRRAIVTWDAVQGATGYIIRFGVDPGKLYHSYMVYDRNKIEINSLNAGTSYFFAIDVFNERSVTKGKTILKK